MKGGSDEKNAVYAVRSLPAFALCRLRTAAPDDIQQVPVSPLPEKGFKVAEIDGCDYYFDTHYLYKLLMGIYGDPPKREAVEEAIWYELNPVRTQGG